MHTANEIIQWVVLAVLVSVLFVVVCVVGVMAGKIQTILDSNWFSTPTREGNMERIRKINQGRNDEV